MAAQDDLRRLSQMSPIYYGLSVGSSSGSVTTWFKGRLQQANDGNWIFRSISSDGTVVGAQLLTSSSWSSSESPATGLLLSTPIMFRGFGGDFEVGSVHLQQQLPQELVD